MITSGGGGGGDKSTFIKLIVNVDVVLWCIDGV